MIGIIDTSDKRYLYLKSYFKEDEVIFSNKIDDFKNISTLILPLLGVDSFLFIKNTEINLMDFYLNNNIKKIICGKKNSFLESYCQKEGIKLVSYLDDYEYIWDNSLLTAEGLLRVIMNDLNDSLEDKKILILGYGFSSKAIYKYLSIFTKNIDIYAKDYHDKKELFSRGITLNNLDNFNYDIIINTIDYNIINKDKLSLFNKDSLIYDLASYPYGFHYDIIDNKLLDIKIIPKIPSLYTPKKAGYNLYKWILKEIEK